MVIRTIRGERQWAAAVAAAADVESLEIHGPATLSLEGIERMTGLRNLTFCEGAPTDQLWRLAGLPALEWMIVQLGGPPHDVASLTRCRIPKLRVYARTAWRALDLARVDFSATPELASLSLVNQSAAEVPWPCGWLAGAPATLMRVMVGGFVPEGETGAVTLEIPPWFPGSPDIGEPWDFTVEDGFRFVVTLDLEELPDAAALRALLIPLVPTLVARMEITDTPDGIRLSTIYWDDLRFLQDLLTTGAPRKASAIEDPALAAFVTAFLAEVEAGRFTGDEEAAAAWVAGLRDLDPAPDDLDDTATREHLFAVIEQPLIAAGLDPETVVLAD
jgi:hypothetical protein